MKYKISKELDEILKSYPDTVSALMRYSLREYFQTGKNPNFKTEELRELWFYIKTHELADKIQRYDEVKGSWFGTFEHLELQSLLSRNCTKFANRNFRLGASLDGIN